MGIIKAFGTAVSSAAADQWKECFYCGSMEGGLLQTRGVRMESARSVNRGSSDVITDGSLIIVADGQCAIATESGAITGVYDRPGENIFSSKRSPGIFSKGGVGSFISDIMSRAQFGGDIVPVTQRLYYINTLEIPGSPFEVNAPIPFRFRDPNTGLDMDGGVFCAGMYSYRIADPELFFKNLSGNANAYYSSSVTPQMDSELLSALQWALALLSEKGMRPSQLIGCTQELCDSLNLALKESWSGQRGLAIASIALSSVDVVDINTMQLLQQSAALRPSHMGATED